MKESIINIPAEPAQAESTEKVKEKANVVSRIQFEQLQESFQNKCLEYDKLLRAYQSMAMKYHTDGEVAKQFVKTATLGLELLFPTTTTQGGPK